MKLWYLEIQLMEACSLKQSLTVLYPKAQLKILITELQELY